MTDWNAKAREKFLGDIARLVVCKLSESGVVIAPDEADYFLKRLGLEIYFKYRIDGRIPKLEALGIDKDKANMIFFGDEEDD